MSIFDQFVPVPRLVARVVGDRTGSARPGPGRVFGPGLRQVEVLVGETTISEPVDPTTHGGPALCRRVAMDGLRALRKPRHETLTAGRANVETFVADDVFGASRLLILDELLAETLLIERPSHGMLVVVPNRHLVAVHILESVRSIPAALGLLGELAVIEYRIAEPVSPWVYFRAPDGRLSLLASPSARPSLDPRFNAVLRDLTSAED
ncbi:MAG: hypothetical protein FWF02_10405 [Micrococcales bacterium]|nr:hypothetical protein [Micrococcales bacterium]MCL2668098.1 hypothetical protein [Micrococcales bacterium]